MISNNLKKRLYTSLALLLLVLLIFNSKLILTYCLIILGVLSILEFLNISKIIFKSKISLILLNFFFASYIFIFCFFFLYFSNYEMFKLILFIILLGCVASDIGGFVFGKFFKGPKITKISPNKTYSGAFGSIIFSSAIVSFLFFYFSRLFNLDIIILAIIISIFSQLGDLLFSLLKRKAKLKDTGNFLPGHGGVLDRIDGILLGSPIGILTLVLLH